MTEKRFEYYETNVVGHITKGVKIIDEFGNEEYISSIREIVWLLKELNEENEQYRKNSISLKQLCKILEETKEYFLSLSECFSEKLFIKTIFRKIDENIESMEEEE